MNESISYHQRLSAIVVLFFLGLLSCNITLPSSEGKDADCACFLHTHGRDSIHLNLSISNNQIVGDLHFDNYQMDSSRGKVTGSFSGDTLRLVYDFMAEGMHNKTEEVFLKQGDQLVRVISEGVENRQVFYAISCP